MPSAARRCPEPGKQPPAAAGATLLQVFGKVSGLDFTGFAVKICDQVFRSMTNWSFVNVWHFNYLLSREQFA